MSQPIQYLIADPSGNITIMVLSAVDQKDYQSIAKALLAKHEEAEQVAFIVPTAEGETPTLNMSGMEFCGNASRAFAYYEVLKKGDAASVVESDTPTDLAVKISGCDTPLSATVHPKSGMVDIEMPAPLGAETVTDLPLAAPSAPAQDRANPSASVAGTLVRLPGITHLVLRDVPATKENFDLLKDWYYGYDPAGAPAFGVMFLSAESADIDAAASTDADAAVTRLAMTPVVYVRDVDTVYFEGSCASGSAACAYALADDTGAKRSFRLIQPDGELTVSVSGKGDDLALRLSGAVSLSEPLSATL